MGNQNSILNDTISIKPNISLFDFNFKIPNDEEINETTINSSFIDLIDAYNGKQIPLTRQSIDNILFNESYFFHGTSSCKAIQILKDGVDSKYYPKELNNADIPNVIGDQAFFLSDNFQKTLWYGDFILVYEMNFNKIAKLGPCQTQTELKDQYKKIEHIIDELDVICVLGYIDRFGNSTIKDETSVINLFSEYSVRNLKILSLKYIIRTNHDPQRLSLNKGNSKYSAHSIIDIKNNLQHSFSIKSIEDIALFKPDAVFIPCTFAEYCYFMQMNDKKIYNKETQQFQPLLQSHDMYDVFVATEYAACPGEFILVVNLYFNTTHVKKYLLPQAFEEIYSFNDYYGYGKLYKSYPNGKYNIELLYVICQFENKNSNKLEYLQYGITQDDYRRRLNYYKIYKK